MGAGAVGCFIGGRLALAGFDVVFVGRAAAKQQIEGGGMTLVDLGGSSQRLPTCRFETDPKALSDRDVTLVCVKSAGTEESGEALAKLLPKGALVVSFQNGVRNAKVLRGVAPFQRVLSGIVGFNVLAQGATFRRATSGPLVIEESPDARARDLAMALRASGLEVEEVAEIEPIQWSKLIMNLANAVGALSGVPTANILLEAGYRKVVRAIMSEALSVMRRAKVKPSRLGAIPVRMFPVVLALPTSVLRMVMRAQLEIDPEARSSMWQDLDKRRDTEVEWLNGEIVRLAAEHGRKAPINERVVALVHEVEKRRAGSPSLSASALQRALSLT